MATETAFQRGNVRPSRSKPGSVNKQTALSWMFGEGDAGRMETIQEHLEHGLDLASVLSSLAAQGAGGALAAPAINANLTLNDTTATELTNTRFTARSAAGPCLIEAKLIFSADAAAVDITDLGVGLSSGAHVSLGWIEYTDTAGVRQIDVVSNTFTTNPHTVVIDVPSGGRSLVNLNWIITQGAGLDFWLEAKTNDDTPGTGKYVGGIVRVYDFASPAQGGTFIAAGATP